MSAYRKEGSIEKTYVTADSPTGVIRIPEAAYEMEGNRAVIVKVVNKGVKSSDSFTYDAVDVVNTIQVQIGSGVLVRLQDVQIPNSASDAKMVHLQGRVAPDFNQVVVHLFRAAIKLLRSLPSKTMSPSLKRR